MWSTAIVLPRSEDIGSGTKVIRNGWARDGTPAASFGAAVYHTNANRGNGNATLWTLTATYALSKRTVLYSEIATVRNSSAPIVHNAVPNGGLVLMPNPLAWRINNLPASELKRIPYTDCIPPRSTRIRH
jgi:hypothetical protein